MSGVLATGGQLGQGVHQLLAGLWLLWGPLPTGCECNAAVGLRVLLELL